MWQFNDEGNLKPFAVKHNDYIKQLMLRRGLLVPEDTILQSGNISVTGRARASLRLKQVNPFENDTTGVQDFFFNLGKKAF